MLLTTTPDSTRRRNAGLLTLAGVVTGLPAAGALVSRTLDTPLTIGGAAISAVPEPSGSLALASLLGGSLLLRSRRKAQGSVAHV